MALSTNPVSGRSLSACSRLTPSSGGRAVDPVDRTVVVADQLQLGLQGCRVGGHLRERFGLLLIGETAGVGEQPEPRDLERERSRVVLRCRLGQRGRLRDPLAGPGEIVLGLLHPVDHGRRDDRRGRRRLRLGRADRQAGRGGDRRCQRGLGVDQFLFGVGQRVLGDLVVVDRRRHRFLGLDQVGTGGLHVADRRGVVGEQLAVAVERFEVPLGVAAELLTGRGERVRGVGDAGLGIVHPGLRRRERILGAGRLLGRAVGRAIVVAAARGRQQGHRDQCRCDLALSRTQHVHTRSVSSLRSITRTYSR